MLNFVQIHAITSELWVPISNHFHIRGANSGKMVFLGGDPLSPHLREPPSPSSMKFCHKTLKTLSYQMVKT